VSLKRTCFAGQAYEIPSKYSLSASLHGAWPETLLGPQWDFASERSSTHSWIFKERESRYVRTVNATWPPCYSTRRHSRVQGNHKSRGGWSQRTCCARATINQALVDVIIARKQAPSHRVFIAQVFGNRYMCGKRRRRHCFSAFWLRSSVVIFWQRGAISCSSLNLFKQPAIQPSETAQLRGLLETLS
jgi:hypothetical protein